MHEKEPVRLHLEGGVAHIVLDSPPDNRMDRHFFNRLGEIVETLKHSADARVVLIYGSGRHFSAGADLEDIKRGIVELYTEGMSLDGVVDNSIYKTACLFSDIESLGIPVIGAISGFCVGSGLELALSCSIRICSEESIFGCPEITWGLITGCSGSIRLERMIQKSRAKEIILSGDMFGAREAYAMGLVNRVAGKRQALTQALRMAKLLADNKIQVKIPD